MLAAAAACLLLAATAHAEAGHYGRALLAAPPPACGNTVPQGTSGASSFTLAFDGASGCFTVGAGAACDPAKGHCCVGGAAPIPPSFNYLLIQPSASTRCATRAARSNITVIVGGGARVRLDQTLRFSLGALPSTGGAACFDFSKASAACNSVSKLCGAGGCGGLLVTKRYAKKVGGKSTTCCVGLGPCVGVRCPRLECQRAAGVCNPATGTCGAGTPKADGTTCSKGTCQGGVCKDKCVGVTCPARKECEERGSTCNRATGLCDVPPPKADGTACSTGSCVGGACTDKCANVTCPPPGECYAGPGACLPVTGTCSYEGALFKDVGAPCSIGGCSYGVCRNFCDGVVCRQGDCEADTGTCNPTTGDCSPGPPADDGTICYIRDAPSFCQAGVCTDMCVGVTCPRGECQTAGTCDPATGMCSEATPLPDQTPCSVGVCLSGECRGKKLLIAYSRKFSNQTRLDTRTTFVDVNETVGYMCGDNGDYVTFVSGNQDTSDEVVLVDVVRAYRTGLKLRLLQINFYAGWNANGGSEGNATITAGMLDETVDSWDNYRSLEFAKTVAISPGRQEGCASEYVGHVLVLVGTYVSTNVTVVDDLYYIPPNVKG